MSFLLNYLDGALDTVTGRYDGEEGEDTPSDGGSQADLIDGDDAGGRTHCCEAPHFQVARALSASHLH